MPVKYIPYVPNTIQGQAILDNLARTRRLLRYRDNGRVYDRIRRGLPLHEVEKIETVGRASDNLLMRGECLSACAYLKDKGIEADLVYIDPPFASGADYAKKVYLRRHPKKAREVAKHDEAVLEAIENGEGIDFEELRAFEEKVYGDIWNKESYLNWMFENLTGIKSVMSQTSSIYVHLDWHIGHYVKIIMDEVFGENNFINEIIWHYPGREMHIENKFNAKHDTIFLYGKTEGTKINMAAVARPHDKQQRLKGLRRKIHQDPDGREWVWETRGQARGQKPYKRYVDEILSEGQALSDVWDDIQFLRGNDAERVDYATQKPDDLIKRIINASSSKGDIVADFFGGSGVAAKVATELGRKFVHVDVGTNSLQTTRDRLKQKGVSFTVMNVLDGVSLFRNPIQTMDKLTTLITGLKKEDSLDAIWRGAIQNSKLGMVPVFLPNLLDHTTKVLDIPLMNKVLREALPDLPDGVKAAIVYYIDIADRKALDKFIKEQNPTDIKIELRDLTQVLDEVVLNDDIKYKPRKTKAGYEIEITRFISDRLQQKIDEYNQKKGLSDKSTLFDSENGEEDDESELEETPKKKTKFKPIEISDDGLELIELVSLDCTASKGQWHADSEIKIDKNGFVIRDGKKTKEFWDAKIQSKKKPLRMKVRNIAGDESILNVEQSN